MSSEPRSVQLERVAHWLGANALRQGYRLVFQKRLGARNELRFESVTGESHLECWFRGASGAGNAFMTSGNLAFGYRSLSADVGAQRLRDAVVAWLGHLHNLGVLEPLLADEITGGGEAVYLLGGDTLELRVTHACNECCVYCSVNSENVPNTATGLGDAIRRTKQAADMGVHRLVVTGGEPTLVPWLGEFLRHVAGQGFRDVELQTNGALLASDGLLAGLAGVPMLTLFVSLPGMDLETVSQATGKTDLFQHKLAGIQAALEAGIPVTLNHVVYAGNLRQVGRFAPGVAARFGKGISKLVYSVVSPSGRADGAGLAVVPRYSEVGPILLSALRSAKELGFCCTLPENCGMPACIQPELREFAEPCEGGRLPRSPDKQKLPHCIECEWEWRCSGVFCRYLDLHGSAEFSGPIRG